MLPLSDDNPTERTPAVTVAFIVACSLVFLYQSSLGSASGETFVYQYGAIPSIVFGQASLPGKLRPFPPMRPFSPACFCTAAGCT